MDLCWQSNVSAFQYAKLVITFLPRSKRLLISWLQSPSTVILEPTLSITNSRSSLRLTSFESVMPSSHFILCHPLLLLPPIPLIIRVFPNESPLRMRWPKNWSSSFNISPSMNTQDGFPLGSTGWISLQSKGLSRVFSNAKLQKHQFLGTRLSL